ncbi:hypothetical protein [Dictyoglomus turgidum]|jgi:hypothetical protein|uniref:hypothetical protein n=1 Tax=Dictyoglomus TaxID=13 RepID=UPI002353174A|nr:hypothetical protein [Dictyoglomus turgidum]
MYELIIYLAKSKGVLSLKDLEDITGLDKEELQKYIKVQKYIKDFSCETCLLRSICGKGGEVRDESFSYRKS